MICLTTQLKRIFLVIAVLCVIALCPSQGFASEAPLAEDCETSSVLAKGESVDQMQAPNSGIEMRVVQQDPEVADEQKEGESNDSSFLKEDVALAKEGVESGSVRVDDLDGDSVATSMMAASPVDNGQVDVEEGDTTSTDPGPAKMVAQSVSAAKFDTPLAAGLYVIATANSTQQVLDVAGGSRADGANVLLWNWHNAAWQKWNITFDSDGLYTIKNAHTGKVLDVAGGTAGKGRNVLSWTDKTIGNANQRWILKKSGTGFILESALNQGYVLDCTGNSAANGTNIEIWLNNGGANQRFNFINLSPDVSHGQSVEDGIYTMGVLRKTSQVVEVEGRSKRSTGNVDLYETNNGMNQRWLFQHVGSGLYKVINVGSGLALDVEGARITAATNVLQYRFTGGKNQLWGVRNNGNNTVTLYSALNGLALDVHGASTANLANLETYYPTGNENQQFVLTKSANDYSGTYVVYTRLSESGLAVDIPGQSSANGVQPALWTDNKQLNQRYAISRIGSSYSIQSVSSGKYLTASSGRIVQMSAQGSAGAVADSQLWFIDYVDDGFRFTNASTGKVMSVAGGQAVKSAKIQEASRGNSAAQKFLLDAQDMLTRGLYQLENAANVGLVLDVSDASFANGANAIVYKATGNNNQKFAIVPVSHGYYRITMALGGTVLGVSGSDGASAKLYN